MATEYNNSELLRRIQGTVKPRINTLASMDEGVKVVIPQNTMNQPIFTRESYEELSKSGTQATQSYITFQRAVNVALANGTTGTIDSIASTSLQPNSIYYIHSWKMILQGSGLALTDFHAWLSAQNTSSIAETDTLLVDLPESGYTCGSGRVVLSSKLVKPIPIQAGSGTTIYARARNSSANAAVVGIVWEFEVRRIESAGDG